MIDRLFVLWRDSVDRTRHVIGQLWRAEGKFYFAYEHDLSSATEKGFRPLLQFPHPRGTDHPYSAAYLFSTFVQRIPSPARPDYSEFLAEIGVSKSDDSLEILARSGGVQVTDALELAEYRADDDGLSRPLTFRLAGEQFWSEAQKVAEGDRVELDREPGNVHDSNATVVLRSGGQKIGYVPRCYSKMIAALLGSGAEIEGEVERRLRMPAELKWAIRVWRVGATGDSH